MKSNSRKRTLFLVTLLTVGTITLIAVSGKDRLVEEWHLHKLADGDESARRRAATVLAHLRSERAIPILLAILEEEMVEKPVDHYAGRALIALGGPSMPILLERLSVEGVRKKQAAALLHRLHQDAFPESIPAYSDALRNGDAPARLWAASALGYFGEAAKVAEPELISALSDPDEGVRLFAVHSLETIGPSPACIEPLTYLARHEIEITKVSAARALLLIGEEGLRAYMEILTDPDGRVRTVAMGAVGEEHDSPVIIAELSRSLKDPNPVIRSCAAAALGRIGKHAVSSLEGVVSRLVDSDATVRKCAVDAIVAVGIQPDRGIALLTPLLSDPDGDVRLAALRAFKSLGSAGADSIPNLMDLLEDDRDFVPGLVSAVIEGIGPAAIPALVEFAQNERLREEIIWILEQLGPEGEKAAGRLEAK